MGQVTVTAKTDLEICVECKCGAVLEVDTVDEGRNGATITVMPCQVCIDEQIAKDSE